ncbi:hypothetical protein HHK36_015109 [Tetracentron sinense]|uniref:Mandelate racemase/muconate lactonizing enzyme C-terminal domain-containing protein n=1 Tax=Tetracentron sinense TaxID=13715 RepID=A0A835DGF0_TETSI|nr:hypothetical protein HHK36_015109 [Tetracentron sinense]
MEMIKGELAQRNAFSSSRSHFLIPTHRSLLHRNVSTRLSFLNIQSLQSLRHFRRNPNLKVVRKMDSGYTQSETNGFLETEDSDSMVDLCITRTLAPALTFEHGLVKLKEAVEKLKSDPPCCGSGIYRFQVAVPPSAKPLNWLCCQPQSSGVFPQFYLSKEMNDPSCELLSLNRVLGVSGIGAAVYFMGSSSCSLGEWNSIKRYLSVDSPLIRAYGFMGINFDTESSSMKHETGSFYFFIPQVELDEYESNSLLAATLAWNDSALCTFGKAVHSINSSLDQAIHHFSPTRESCDYKAISSTLKEFDLMEDKNIQMGQAPSSYQFYFRLSPTITVTTPGSRSSPLAVAASSHPLTTCISCFDERSLAFHALGYGKGSYRPAVVITSSGTAVSNLLPAVVEASQCFIPLLLLTADRPPELHDAGANQAINQVNHFGSFVRFFFSLPPPTDQIPARMVLTTVDSAVYWATSVPYGPVHINCPFREPLGDAPRKWMLSCLEKLDFWMSRAEPFTKYIQVQHSHACNDICGQMAEVVKVIQNANQGILLIGAIHTEDDMWAALLLAKHLFWPVVADILSGLRMRKVLSSFPEIEENFLFLDHLDHALLSDSVRGWAQADVIVQIGSRITSKRITQMIEICSPCSYITVDKHPYRHDPSHIVTHRIQSTITEFADSLLKAHFPRTRSKWTGFMRAVDMMVAWEISFQIHSEYSLTEPYVSQVVSEALPSDAALFIGNSMVIRDADMYGRNWVTSTTNIASIMSSWELPCHGIRVAANRGASGIDGLLSTAIGFAVGCNKRVFCVLGDVSFLHDTNGLAILNQRTWRKPMTILVINNHGGAIFSFLPIADTTEPSVLNQYFYTSHNVSIRKLCMAHSVKHLQVRTKMELRDALFISEQAQTDCLIEVESCIEANATFHRIELCAPPTSTPVSNDAARFYREGFILALSLEDGSVGFGEVAPLEIHKENIIDVEEQLRYLLHVIQGAKISYLLPLLKGSFSSWIWCSLGIMSCSIFPSVRCGLEMAILNALAARQGSSLLNLLLYRECSTSDTQSVKAEEIIKRSSRVQICALLDSNGTPKEVAYVAAKLVEEGFTTIKLKVGRRANPIEDAAIIHEIREKVGHQINLRADANRNWTFEEAVQFGSCVKCCDLQYIEEPVHYEDDIIKFCEETGLPVALDETINNIQENPLKRLAKFIHTGIVAIVIKPSVVGGFENAALIAQWAQMQGKMAVISSAFESSLSLSAYIQFSCYLEQQNAKLLGVKNMEPSPSIAHGLGTYQWLREDVTTESLRICRHSYGDTVEASVEDAARFLQDFKIDRKIIQRCYTGEQVRAYQLTVDCEGFSCSIKVWDAGLNTDDNVFVFLHGFLGTGEDWIPIMKAISGCARCISVDLPGHGGSHIQNHSSKQAKLEPSMSIEVVADVLCKTIHNITPGRVILVGYSMGARIALYMALRCNDKIDGAVVIAGSPGIKDVAERRVRMALDDARARSLIAHGLQFFLDTWYAGELWKSLREHPHFKQIISSRSQHDDVHALAKALSNLSIGRQSSLWEDLKQCKTPLLFIVGEKDRKFKEIAQQMCYEISHSSKSGADPCKEIHEMVEIPNCGHAAHLENPLPVINAVRQFFTGLNRRRSIS